MASSLLLGTLGQSCLKWLSWPHWNHFAAMRAALMSIGVPCPLYVVPVAIFFSGVYVDV